MLAKTQYQLLILLQKTLKKKELNLTPQANH